MQSEARHWSVEPISVDQYVRVRHTNGKCTVGRVCSFSDSHVTVFTSNGYEIEVDRSLVTKAFLLILDLNGVLVARGRGVCVHRPYADEFLDFAFENFAVGVWTSGLQRTCDPIIDSVMEEYKNRLLFTYYREHCVPAPTPDKPFGTRKDLQFVFAKFPESFHSANTIIIDDTPEKCSHPDIALCPSPFTDPVAQKDDTGLRAAVEVLRDVLSLGSHFPLIHAAEERLSRLHIDPQHAEPRPQAPPASDHANTKSEAVHLWSYRLCCDYLHKGHCKRSTTCSYRHEDDGVSPCSRKGACTKGHAARWKQE